MPNAPHWLVRAQRVASRQFSGIVGFAMLGAVLTFAFASQLLGAVDPNRQDLRARLQPPGTIVGERALPFGSDRLGRDVLSRVMQGTRVSLATAFIASTVAAVFGTVLGLSAAFTRGWWATFVNRLVDVQHSIPLLVVAVAVLAVLDPSWGLIVGLLVIWAWVPFARVAWGSSLSVLERDYVTAAVGLGAGPGRIMFRHVLPNIITAVLVMWTFQFAYLIIIESSLSFLGVGIPPPTPSLGRMLRDASSIIDRAVWLAIYPGMALVTTVLAINLLGDWLSDRFSRR